MVNLLLKAWNKYCQMFEIAYKPLLENNISPWM